MSRLVQQLQFGAWLIKFRFWCRSLRRENVSEETESSLYRRTAGTWMFELKQRLGLSSLQRGGIQSVRDVNSSVTVWLRILVLTATINAFILVDEVIVSQVTSKSQVLSQVQHISSQNKQVKVKVLVCLHWQAHLCHVIGCCQIDYLKSWLAVY